MSNKIIQQLLAVKGLAIECPKPDCGKHIPIAKANLFSMHGDYPVHAQKNLLKRLEQLQDLIASNKEQKLKLAKDKKTKHLRITGNAQGSNFGQIAEQIIPAFAGFPYTQEECRPMFKPVDYLVFLNLARGGVVKGIKFVEVKTGDNGLERNQKQVRQCISDKKLHHTVLP